MARLAEAANTHSLNRVETGNGKTAVITSGIAYQYAREVFGEVSYLKLGMVHPLPERMVLDFAQGREELYVIEEGDPFLETQLKALGIRVTGKKLFPATGELLPGVLRERISGQRPRMRRKKQRPERKRPEKPFPCGARSLPGCPHRGFTS